MPCRDEMNKRINFAFAVTERKENRTLREKSHFAGAKRFVLWHLEKAQELSCAFCCASVRDAPLQAESIPPKKTSFSRRQDLF